MGSVLKVHLPAYICSSTRLTAANAIIHTSSFNCSTAAVVCYPLVAAHLGGDIGTLKDMLQALYLYLPEAGQSPQLNPSEQADALQVDELRSLLEHRQHSSATRCLPHDRLVLQAWPLMHRDRCS